MKKLLFLLLAVVAQAATVSAAQLIESFRVDFGPFEYFDPDHASNARLLGSEAAQAPTSPLEKAAIVIRRQRAAYFVAQELAAKKRIWDYLTKPGKLAPPVKYDETFFNNTYTRSRIETYLEAGSTSPAVYRAIASGYPKVLMKVYRKDNGVIFMNMFLVGS